MTEQCLICKQELKMAYIQTPHGKVHLGPCHSMYQETYNTMNENEQDKTFEQLVESTELLL